MKNRLLNFRFILLTFFLVTFLVSCSSVKKVDNIGQRFPVSIPNGWKITESKEYFDETLLLSMQKKGFGESALIMVIVSEGEGDLIFLIDTYYNSFSVGVYGKFFDQWTDKYASNYAGVETVSRNFSGSIFTLPHQGQMHAFNCNGKSYVVIMQEAVEDHSKNKKDFDYIEKGFQCYKQV